MEPTSPAPIVGIGKLVDKGAYWQLVYEPCGHTLAIPKFADLDPVKQVRHLHAICVECVYQRRYASRARQQASHNQIELTDDRLAEPRGA